MKVRLGYVSLSKTIDLTASKTITYTQYQKNKNINEIYNLINQNLDNLYQILLYNKKNNIHFYRMTSKLIPLVDLVKTDYINNFKEKYKKIGLLIKDNNMRVDFHPNQFTILNSTKKEVIQNTINILNYHYKLLEAFGIENKIIILHIGSSVLGKANSIKRFINNFNRLDDKIKKCIAIENDDKIYNLEDIIYISNIIKVPIVIDVHHHNCNNKDNIEKYIGEAINSWNKNIPKFHFSSPKNKTKKEFRSHNDYIDVDEFIKFINIMKKYDKDIDIMIEAKEKDNALFKLVRQLKYKTDFKFIDETTFII